MRANTRWLTNQADPDVILMQDIRKLNQLGDKYGDDPVLVVNGVCDEAILNML